MTEPALIQPASPGAPPRAPSPQNAAGNGALEAAILHQLAEAGTRSIGPSDVARRLADGKDGWQALLGPVRRAALTLQAQGRIDILRKGRPVPAQEARGVIRLRLRPSPPTDQGAA